MCRLLVVDREKCKTEHKIFKDILDFINPEDVLVVNSSKVIPARLIGLSEKGKEIELLLLKQIEGGEWETLTRPGKRAKKKEPRSLSKLILS